MDQVLDPNQKHEMSKEDMVITFEQIRRVSDLHYQKHKKEKKKAKKLFESLDGDGDGWIAKEDVMRVDMVAGFGKSFLKNAFIGLDGDGDGYLSFDDSKALLYLADESKRRCRACDRSLLYGHGFSCEQCVQEQADDFSLCYGCFKSQGIEHIGHGYLHFLHDFVFHQKLLEMSVPSSPHPLPSPPDQEMKQCIICGDFHQSMAAGFMCNAHMCPMPDSNDEYVCEWCFCYFCSKCGNPFRDNPKAAIPGKWLQRRQCLTCSKKQTSQDLYGTVIQRFQSSLSHAAILEQCKTCKAKQRNGRLFLYVDGSNVLNANNAHTKQRPQHQQLQAQLAQNQFQRSNQPPPVHNTLSKDPYAQPRPLHQPAFFNNNQQQQQQMQAQFQLEENSRELQHQRSHQFQQQPAFFNNNQQQQQQQQQMQARFQPEAHSRELQHQMSHQFQQQPAFFNNNQQQQQMQAQFQPEANSRELQHQMNHQFQQSNNQQSTNQQSSKKTVNAMKTVAAALTGVGLGGIALKALAGTFGKGQASPGQGQGLEQGLRLRQRLGKSIFEGQGQGQGQWQWQWQGQGQGQGQWQGQGQRQGQGDNNFGAANPDDASSVMGTISDLSIGDLASSSSFFPGSNFDLSMIGDMASSSPFYPDPNSS